MPFATFTTIGGNFEFERQTSYSYSESFSTLNEYDGAVDSLSGATSYSENLIGEATSMATYGTDTTNTSTAVESNSTGIIVGTNSFSFDQFLYSQTTWTSSANVNHKRTVSTQLTLELPYLDESGSFISQTYTQKTTTQSAVTVSYTTTKSSSSYGFGASGYSFNKILGAGYFVAGRIGTKWTQDFSSLEYHREFVSEGVFDPFYSQFGTNLFMDSIEEPLEISLGTEYTQSAYVNLSITGAGEKTIFPEITEVLSFQSLSFTNTTNTISSRFIFFDSLKMFYSTESLTQPFQYLVPVSKTEEITIQQEITSSNDNSQLALGFMTSTSIGTRKTTIEGSGSFSSYTFFTQYSYSQSIRTTYSDSYIISNFGQLGQSTSTASYTSSNETIFYDSDGNPTAMITESGESAGETTASFAIPYRQLAKTYIAVIGQGLSSPLLGNPTFFTQKAPLTSFVCASSSSGLKYANLLPESNISKIIFTTYAFQPYGVSASPPIFAVPINGSALVYDDIYTGTVTATISQFVSIPSEYYSGEESATVTISSIFTTDTGLTSETSTYAIGYGDSESSFFTMGQSNKNNFFYSLDSTSFASRIYHSVAVGTTAESEASWSLDRFLYWTKPSSGSGGPARTTSGSNFFPVQAVGTQEQHITVVASKWVEGFMAMGGVGIVDEATGSYVNSFLR